MISIKQEDQLKKESNPDAEEGMERKRVLLKESQRNRGQWN